MIDAIVLVLLAIPVILLLLLVVILIVLSAWLGTGLYDRWVYRRKDGR